MQNVLADVELLVHFYFRQISQLFLKHELAGWITPERHFDHTPLICGQPERLAFLIAFDNSVYELNGPMVVLDWRFTARLS